MTDLTNRRPILCLDFDGVCHMYNSGWKGAAVIPDEPVPGLFEFLLQAINHFEVNIYSSRSGQEGGIVAMQQWFIKHCPKEHYPLLAFLQWPTVKPPAFLGIDDRVLTFTGSWPTVDEMKNFKPWNLKGV